MPDDRRIFRRSSLQVPVIIDDKEKAEIKNISVGGLCLITSRLLLKGCKVLLKFTIPNNEEITSQGHIAWSRKKSIKECECGFEFDNMTVNDYEKIRGYIQTREN